LVDLAPDERRARLDALSLTDHELARLHALFDADRGPPSLLSVAVVDVIDRLSVDSDLIRGLIGSNVGSFRLLALIGEGGSSAVFRAERAAGSGAQTVALKLLRTGLFSADGQRRFRREQSILAQLTHPNIAHLIEGGISDAGIPYIAMEFVDGRPITQEADARALSLAGRLRLFAILCRAIDAAHAALVVHRDLKPSNVFVTHQGELKVLDFGIAKLLDDDASAMRTQSIMLTPEYAAPEQYGVGPVTVAVDVYALGVLLGELLTGKRLGSSAKTSASASVLGAQPLSTLPGLPPRAVLARQLHGDLDAIIANALADEPALRYRSAGALADDIECYLEKRPVRAHPPSRWYRARKFAARHRGGVAITAMLVVGILASLALALWQADVARREAQRANSVRDFVEHVFDPVREGVAESKLPSIRDLVTAGVKRLDETTTLGPHERVDLTLMFARLHNEIGDRPRAVELADAAYRLASSSLAPLDPLTIDALNVRGAMAVRNGDFATGEPALIETERRLRAAGIGGLPRIRVLDTLAYVAMERDHNDAALALEQRALDERVRTFGADAKETVAGYNNLGYGLEGVGQFDAAADAYRNGYEVDIRYRDPDSYDVLTDLSNLGSTMLRAGHVKGAREWLAKAQDGFDHLGGKPRTVHVLNAQKLCAADTLLFDMMAAQRSCAAMQRLTDDLAGVTDALRGDSLRPQAQRQFDAGDLVQSRATLERILTLYATTPEQNSSRRGSALRSRAEVAWLEGDAAGARDDTIAARGLLASVPDYPATLGVDGLLLLACTRAPAATCAADLESNLHAKLDRYAHNDHPRLLLPRLALARHVLDRGDAPAARGMIEAALESARPEFGDSHPLILTARLWRAVAFATSGECAAAGQEAAAVEIATAASAAVNYPWLIEARSELARAGHCKAVRP
jgi:serine/threonine-protein kinase